MSIQEKKAIFGMISTLLIMGGYVFYTFGLNAEYSNEKINDPQFWGNFMLIMVGVSIGLKIIGHIIFHLYLVAAHREENPDFLDEYDKQIEMRSERNSHYVFLVGFMASWIPLAMGEPISVMFIILLISGTISGVLDDAWKLYYYKKGL